MPKKKARTYLENLYNQDITCPHCGYEPYSDDFQSDEGESECDACEKPFRYKRNVQITYSTFAIDAAREAANGA